MYYLDLAPDLTFVLTAFPLDRRQGPIASAQPVCVISATDLSPALGNIIFNSAGQSQALVGPITDENMEIPLLPGSTLTVTQAAAQVNTGLTANFQWRERYLEESERI
jgi:hypothetical protein